ncbi:MAG: hypothetical protein MZW92_50060 [Comamonadaceae bacterium]|nr:hypothetical protein [Comamonadaceae bacterium]
MARRDPARRDVRPGAPRGGAGPGAAGRRGLRHAAGHGCRSMREAVAQVRSLPQVVLSAARARPGAFAGSAAAVPAERARRVQRWCRSPSASPSAAEVAEVIELLWGGDETLIVDQLRPLALPSLPRGAGASIAPPPTPSSRSIRNSITSRPAAPRRSPACCCAPRRHGLRAAAARSAQLRRHGRRSRAGGRLRASLRLLRRRPSHDVRLTWASVLLRIARNAIGSALRTARRRREPSTRRWHVPAPPSSP